MALHLLALLLPLEGLACQTGGILDNAPRLDDAGIRQDRTEPSRYSSHFLDPEKEGFPGSGKLQESRAAGSLVRRESWAGFRIETNDFLAFQIPDRFPEILAEVVDYLDLSGKGSQLQTPYFFRANRYLEHGGKGLHRGLSKTHCRFWKPGNRR